MEELLSRNWGELIARDGGPLHGRFVLQPLVATALAIRAGWRDAREGRRLFFWTLVGNPEERQHLLGQLWRDVGKLFLVAVLLDVVYQILVLRWVHPVQLVLVATTLALVPYLVVRGLTNRVVRRPRGEPADDKGVSRMTQEAAEKATPGPDQVKLALERTFLAYERTLMAWNRTAASLITFGFALYKFFFYLHQEKPPTEGEQIFGARTYGLCIMAIGVFTLVVATWQHRQQLKALRTMYPEAPMSLSLVLATLMGTLGVVAFTVGIFRL